MKKHKIIFSLSILTLCLSLSFIELFAQRRVVVETPRKTVVVRKTPRKTKVVYTRAAPKVRTVRAIPGKAIIVTHRATKYQYHAGVFYRFNGAGYVVVAPPVGVRISVLPVGHRRVYAGPRAYFYFGGVFYVRNEGSAEYEVVNPPEGAIVHTLPKEAESIAIEGKIYYAYNNTIYQRVEMEGGEAFEVMGDIKT